MARAFYGKTGQSPWQWRELTPPAHVLHEDIVTNESLQVRSAPLYDAVVVTGELAGKGVTCKVCRAGEAGQLFAPQVSGPKLTRLLPARSGVGTFCRIVVSRHYTDAD